MTKNIVVIIHVPYQNEQNKCKDTKLYSITITKENNKTPDQLVKEKVLEYIKEEKLNSSGEFNDDNLEFDFNIIADELDNYHKYNMENRENKYPSFHEFCQDIIKKINPNFFENNDNQYFQKIDTIKFSDLYSFKYYDEDREIYEKEKEIIDLIHNSIIEYGKIYLDKWILNYMKCTFIDPDVKEFQRII